MLVLRRRDFYEIIRKEAPLAVNLLWSFVQVLTERLRKTTAELSAGRADHPQPAIDLDLLEEVSFDG